jgi:hypothetical protein
MIHSTKHITTALAVSTTLVIFNIIVVTQGSADTYYRNFEQFLISILPAF